MVCVWWCGRLAAVAGPMLRGRRNRSPRSPRLRGLSTRAPSTRSHLPLCLAPCTPAFTPTPTQFPTMLEKALGKLMSLRDSFGGMLSQVSRMVGAGGPGGEDMLEGLLGKLDALKVRRGKGGGGGGGAADGGGGVPPQPNLCLWGGWGELLSPCTACLPAHPSWWRQTPLSPPPPTDSPTPAARGGGSQRPVPQRAAHDVCGGVHPRVPVALRDGAAHTGGALPPPLPLCDLRLPAPRPLTTSF